jgi:hypothetical protein
VNQAGGRRGDRLWPAVFVVSALLAVGAIWRLDPEVAPRAVAESMVTVATAASPAANATTQERIAAGRSAKVRDHPATPWPTHAANPEQVDSDQRGLPQLLIIPRIELEMPIVATKVDKAGLEIQRLPHPRGTILRLAFWEGRSYPQIAEQLELPLGTVKSHARRALLHLRTRLTEVTSWST